MLEINIPGYRKLQLKHIVLDYNGTIACDGELIAGVKENLTALADKLQVSYPHGRYLWKGPSRS